MASDSLNLDLFTTDPDPTGPVKEAEQQARPGPHRQAAGGPEEGQPDAGDAAIDLSGESPAAAEPLSGPPPLWLEETPRSTDETAGGEPASFEGGPAVARSDDRAAARGQAAVHTDPRVWSVSEVNRDVRALLEGAFPHICVEGEVGRWTRHASGHCYFTLKDERSQLRCVMFQSDAARLPLDPDEGLKVRAVGGLTLYEARGAYQLTVRQLETATGEGLWRLAFERLRKKLDAEGLLAPDRKRPVPRFPTAVGIVTSASGAALKDIVTVIRRRAPWTRVVLNDARVQGQGAGAEIAAALDTLGASGLVDVIIVGRGGGSIEDLWAFNEELVARAIADCPVPVISAVGHEVDTTISDLVADLRAPTPSAAAEAAVPDQVELERSLEVARGRLIRGLRGGVARRRLRMREEVSHLGRAARRVLEPRHRALLVGRDRMERAVRRLMQPRRQELGAQSERAERAVRRIIDVARRNLAAVAGKMDALSPLATLQRGYAVPLDDEGRVLRTVTEVDPGDRFRLRLVDGRVHCEALDTEAIGGGRGSKQP